MATVKELETEIAVLKSALAIEKERNRELTLALLHIGAMVISSDQFMSGKNAKFQESNLPNLK
jgi:hypothetical protein